MRNLVVDNENIAVDAIEILEQARRATLQRVIAAHDAYRDSLVDEKIQNWHYCKRINAVEDI